MAERKTKVELDVELSGFLAKMRLAKAAVSDMGSKWQELSKKGKTQGLENGLMSVTAAVGALAVAAVATAAQYEVSVSRMQAATNASAEQMNQLKDATLAAGRSGVFSANEAAQAVTELGKASLSAQQIIDGGLQGALDLAAAGEMAVGEAAENAASAMSMFSLEAESVPHIADLLAAGAGKAQGEVRDMAMALNQAGLVAAQTGLTIEETTGALAAMASAGLIGSDAGTSLKTMLMRLSGPTAEAKTLMDDLGISAFDAQGNFVGLANFAGSLQGALRGMSDEQRQATLTTIFGSDAVRAAAVIYQQGGKGLDEWIGKVNDSGYAAEQARIKNDNLVGDLKKLRGAFEGALIGQGGGATGVLRDIAQALTGVVNGFASLPGPVQTVITWFVLLAGATTGLVLLYAKVVPAFAAARTALMAMGVAGQFAARAMTMLGTAMKFAGYAGLILGIAFALDQLVMSLSPKEEPIVAEVDALSASLKELASTGKASGEFARVYGENLGIFANRIKTITDEIAALQEQEAKGVFEVSPDAGASAAWEEAKDNIYSAADAAAKLTEVAGPLDEAFTQLVQGGNAGLAANSFQQLSDAMLAAGVPQEQITAAFPKYTAAVLAAQQANTGLADGFGSAAAKGDLLDMTLYEAMNTGRSLTQIFEELNGAALEFADAEISAEQAVDDFRAALEASNGSLDTNTQAGRDAKSAMLDLFDAAISATEAKYKETGSVEDAYEVYQSYIGQLRTMAKQYPELADDVETLIRLYGKLPSTITTQVITHYKSLGEKRRGVDTRGLGYADGAVVDYFAGGAENHVAQIAPAGSWRVWGEPETGGEAYIPLAPHKRARSEQILMDVARRFGMFQPVQSPSSGGSGGMHVENLNVRAYSNDFSLRQIEQRLQLEAAT